jgi:hypothetical protein
MNFLTLLINRIYYFLANKTKNQSPFLGAVILVSVIGYFLFCSLVLLIYLFSEQFVRISHFVHLLIGLCFFVALNYYSRKMKSQIMYGEPKRLKRTNYLVVAFCLVVMFLFISLANVNRSKIFAQTKARTDEAKKDSLEERVRKLF